MFRFNSSASIRSFQPPAVNSSASTFSEVHSANYLSDSQLGELKEDINSKYSPDATVEKIWRIST